MSNPKNIKTLIPDILSVLHNGKEPTEEHLDIFANDCKEALRDVLTSGAQLREPTIRMSNIGTHPRKMWYEFNSQKERKPIDAQLVSMFAYGHLIEAMMLLFARHAGHTVERQQEEVELHGILGHIDCFIDGELVDVKGMSQYGFKKFKDGTILQQDDYGYISQICGYGDALEAANRFFFVFEKSNSDMCLFEVPKSHHVDAGAKIDRLKVVIEMDEPPEERCFEPVPISKTDKSGNLMLDKGCKWCDYKEECWSHTNNGKGLRVFAYSNELRYLTHVEKEPRVNEVFPFKKDEEIDPDFDFIK